MLKRRHLALLAIVLVIMAGSGRLSRPDAPASRAKPRINEITVSASSAFSGVTIQDSGLGDRFTLVLLADRRPGTEIVFRPGAGEALEPGMTLIVMGDVGECHRARKYF